MPPIKRDQHNLPLLFQAYLIRQWTIHKITPYLDNNKWLKRLDTQLIEPTNQITVNVPKVVKPPIKKTL